MSAYNKTRRTYFSAAYTRYKGMQRATQACSARCLIYFPSRMKMEEQRLRNARLPLLRVEITRDAYHHVLCVFCNVRHITTRVFRFIWASEKTKRILPRFIIVRNQFESYIIHFATKTPVLKTSSTTKFVFFYATFQKFLNISMKITIKYLKFHNALGS